VIAHRGDSAHLPENTLAALAGALELGVSAVEIDVQLTRDGRIVVIHDSTLDRTTSGRGDVRQMTLAQVRAVSAGYPSRFGDAYQGEHVPTLAEVVTLLRDRARILIEIKKESVTEGRRGRRRGAHDRRDPAPGRGELGRAHLLRPARDPARARAGARDQPRPHLRPHDHRGPARRGSRHGLRGRAAAQEPAERQPRDRARATRGSRWRPGWWTIPRS
jgi:hypothetical protein